MTLISKTPWVDRTQFSWDDDYPKCTKEDRLDFEATARAFKEVGQVWSTHPDLNALCQDFNLSGDAQRILHQYTEQLEALRALILAIENNNLETLSPEVLDKVTALCPNVARAFVSMKNTPESRYTVSKMLLQNLLLCMDSTELLRSLAVNPLLFEEAAVEPSILMQDILVAMANKNALPKDKYDVAIKTVKESTPHSAALLRGILQHADLPLDELKTLLKDSILSDIHFKAIIERKLALDNVGLFELLFTKADSLAKLNSLQHHPMFQALSTDMITVLCNEAADPLIKEFWTHHPNSAQTIERLAKIPGSTKDVVPHENTKAAFFQPASDSKKKLEQQTLFDLKRMSLMAYPQLKSVDWLSLPSRCKTQETQTELLILETNYLLLHLAAKQSELHMKDNSITKLRNSYQVVIEKYRDTKHDQAIPKVLVEETKKRMEKVAVLKVLSQHRGFFYRLFQTLFSSFKKETTSQKILSHLAKSLAELTKDSHPSEPTIETPIQLIGNSPGTPS